MLGVSTRALSTRMAEWYDFKLNLVLRSWHGILENAVVSRSRYPLICRLQTSTSGILKCSMMREGVSQHPLCRLGHVPEKGNALRCGSTRALHVPAESSADCTTRLKKVSSQA